MVVSVAEANLKVQKTVVNMDRFDRIVNGDINEVVEVDDGFVRSLRGIEEFGKPGAQGNPGGNVMAIGRFAAASGLTIPTGTDVVRTRGYDAAGLGIADYYADAAVNAAYVEANPRTSFISANGRGFRLYTEGGVYVTQCGAKGDGVTNDTAAFNTAIATGRRVYVPTPAVAYRVNGITVVPNMYMVGEKGGESLGPTLLVTETDGCVFLQPTSTEGVVPHLHFENLTMAAADGVAGATGFRSADRTVYTGYCNFINIETHRSLLWGFDLLPIYVDWINCRDGYLPGIVPTGGFPSAHGFIRADAPTYGQTNATNTNNVMRCKVFRGFGVDASIQISYGDSWTISGLRVENTDVPAVRARSVRQLVFESIPRAEGSRMPSFLVAQEMSGSGVGTTYSIRGGIFAVDTPGFVFVTADGLSRGSIDDNEFAILRAGAVLCDNPGTLVSNNNNKTAGAGASTFLNGSRRKVRLPDRELLNGGVDNLVSNMSLQNEGGMAATGGFLSRANISVGTEFVTIATSETGLGGTCIVSGFDAMGGSQIRLIKDWQFTTIRDVVDPFNGTGKTLSFQVIGSNLQMKVSAGTLTVFTTLMH